MHPKNYGDRSVVTLIFTDIEIIETIVYIPIKTPHSKTKKLLTKQFTRF
jgi:hypothetical protein